MSRPIVIAIDGPAASGKSSTAKAVARALDYRHLDSGAFYRTITLAALATNIDPASWEGLSVDDLEGFEVSARPTGTTYELRIGGAGVGDRIRAPEVTENVSRMAAVPAVRSWLLGALRAAGRGGALVADGRDIGTVVFPDAELKIFLVCDPEERALRRLRQRGVEPIDAAELRAEAERLVARDQLDQTRAAAPLLRAPDAVVLDNTALAFDAQVRAITRMARALEGGRDAGRPTLTPPP